MLIAKVSSIERDSKLHYANLSLMVYSFFSISRKWDISDFHVMLKYIKIA